MAGPKKQVQKRISVAVSDDLYDWIVQQAGLIGLVPGTYCTISLNEYRRMKESNENISELMKTFAKENPKEWESIILGVSKTMKMKK
jgi:hypothetical protein